MLTVTAKLPNKLFVRQKMANYYTIFGYRKQMFGLVALFFDDTDADNRTYDYDLVGEMVQEPSELGGREHNLWHSNATGSLEWNPLPRNLTLGESNELGLGVSINNDTYEKCLVSINRSGSASLLGSTEYTEKFSIWQPGGTHYYAMIVTVTGVSVDIDSSNWLNSTVKFSVHRKTTWGRSPSDRTQYEATEKSFNGDFTVSTAWSANQSLSRSYTPSWDDLEYTFPWWRFILYKDTPFSKRIAEICDSANRWGTLTAEAAKSIRLLDNNPIANILELFNFGSMISSTFDTGTRALFRNLKDLRGTYTRTAASREKRAARRAYQRAKKRFFKENPDLGFLDYSNQHYLEILGEESKKPSDFTLLELGILKDAYQKYAKTEIKDLSSLYLMWHYGWSLTASDLVETVNAFHKFTNWGQSQYQTAGASREVHLEDAVPGYHSMLHETKHLKLLTDAFSQEWFVRSGVLNNLHRSLYEFDIKPSASNLWDLVPFSFVVDWFLPIGDYLENEELKDYSKTLPVHAAFYSSKTDWFASASDWAAIPFVKGHVHFTVYRRECRDRLYVPAMSEQAERLPSGHLVEATALLIQSFVK